MVTLNDIPFILGILAFVLALIASIIYNTRSNSKKNNIKNIKVIHAGELVINRSDPNKDVMRFELAVPIGDLENYEEIIFRVVKD